MYLADDRSGLGNRRLHDRPGDLGLPAGLIVGVMSLVGFATGALIGSRLAPLVLTDGSDSPYAPLLAALGALFGGALVAVDPESWRSASATGDPQPPPPPRRRRRRRGARRLYRARRDLGLRRGRPARAGHPDLRADVQRSLILRSLNELLPPSGPVLNAIDRVDPAPSIVGPETPLGKPDPRDHRRPRRPRRRRLGGESPRNRLRARDRGLRAGSAPGLIVTNAHVVAGEDDTSVETRRRLAGRHRRPLRPRKRPRAPPRRRLAPGPGWRRDRPRRARRDPRLPRERPLRGRPRPLRRNARRGQRRLLWARPAAALDRSLRGSVAAATPAALVDSRGRVLGTVFATTTTAPRAASPFPTTIVDAALTAPNPVDTGPCTGGLRRRLHFSISEKPSL